MEWTTSKKIWTIIGGLVVIGIIYWFFTRNTNAPVAPSSNPLPTKGSPSAGNTSSNDIGLTTSSIQSSGIQLVPISNNPVTAYNIFKSCLTNVVDARGFNNCLTAFMNNVPSQDKITNASGFVVLNKIGTTMMQATSITSEYVSNIMKSATFGDLRNNTISWLNKYEALIIQQNEPDAQRLIEGIRAQRTELTNAKYNKYNGNQLSLVTRKKVTDGVQATCKSVGACCAAVVSGALSGLIFGGGTTAIFSGVGAVIGCVACAIAELPIVTGLVVATVTTNPLNNSGKVSSASN